MEWINIKDKMPDSECIAIGYQNEIVIGYISEDRIGGQRMGTGYICVSDNETLTHVTHWIPLPEPPQE